MPNGGSDCCGTCWFNSANDGKAGFQKHGDEVEVRCVIRDAEIAHPFWTYCANHPHHNPDRIDVPIGPIYVDSGGDFPYRRRLLLDSPDTEEIRVKLLELLRSIQETPRNEYPTPTKLDETVIIQLGMFHERRAVDDLRRIISFDPLASSEGKNPFRRNRILTISRAIEALSRIVGADAISEIERLINLGLDVAAGQSEYNADDDALAAIRYWAVKSLENLAKEEANELLIRAMDDPNPNVAEIARQLHSQ